MALSLHKLLTVARRAIFHSALLLGICATLAGPRAYAQSTSASEYQIKAAFVLNFVRFIEWPDNTNRSEVSICILGQDPFGPFIDELAARQPVKVSIHRISKIQSDNLCNLMFISQSERESLEKILAALADESVVTVSYIPGFVSHHGTIGLIIEDEKVRFEIGLAAAKDTKIIISSKLLSLARNRGTN